MKIFQPKEWVFDRIEQTVPIFLKNIFKLVLPYILYQVLFVTIVWSVFMFYVWVWILWILKSNGWNFWDILYNPMIIYFMFFGFILFLFFALGNIPIVLATLKSIKQCLNKQEITPLENIKWWIKNIFQSFKTYWYIFAYIYLIPALIFIGWWLMFIGGMWENKIQWLINFWIIFMIISFLLFLFFAIYRGTKTSFSLISAVNKENFNKQNFKKSVEITQNNWWRIFGNLFLIWIVIGFWMSFINGILGLLLPGSFNFNALFQWSFDSINFEKIIWILDTFNPFLHILNAIIKNILQVIWIVFIMMFTYVFMLRLEDERQNKTDDIIINNLDWEL